MDDASKPRHFDEKDVDLLEVIVDLVPDLDVVAYAAKLARKRIRYPIEGHSGLLPLFGDAKSGRARFKNRQLTYEQAERFLPGSFFPIESERDFVRKLLIAFQRGRLSHAREESDQAEAGRMDPAGEVTILPSPGVGAFGGPS